MKKYITTRFTFLLQSCASLLLLVATLTAGTTCRGPYYQPATPERLRK